MLRRFTYPEGYDKEKCRGHVMVLARKALRNFRYKLNKEYVQKGETPFTCYNYVLPEVWEQFVRQKQTLEAKAKSE